MKSRYAQSVKTQIEQDLHQCRQLTLNIFKQIESEQFYQQAHPDFSPVGWHLGHIAFTEAYWILEYLGGLPPLFPEYKSLFAADGLPKTQRQNLPSPEFIQDYLNIVREEVLAYFNKTSLAADERLWRWLIQHESQHGETIAIILHLFNSKQPSQNQLNLSPPIASMITIPSGEFILGSNEITAQDNESPTSLMYLDTYAIDKYPVTCGEYQEFITLGGYDHPQYWSEEGWYWKESNFIIQPLYWHETRIRPYHPVYGVSYYEAQAYARFVGKRLPTELEWEKAASWHPGEQKKYHYPWGDGLPNLSNCNHNLNMGGTTPVNAYPQSQSPYGCYDLLGNVWEWTASDFAGYSGFISYPYPGYSQTYFDNKHRVLRGGSWATRLWALRSSFRNWYYPEARQVLAGFRCVS